MPQHQGPPPEECAQDMKFLKFSVIGMMGCGAGRLIFSFIQGIVSIDIFAIFNLFLNIVMGTFLFKDDEHLKHFYKCLEQTICQPCVDQLHPATFTCLVPLMICSIMNAVIDLIMRYPYFAILPYGFFLAGSIASQFCAGWFSWQVFKVIKETHGSGGGLEMGSSNPRRSGYREPGEAPAQQDVGQANTTGGASGPGFVPFAGAGNRLGS